MSTKIKMIVIALFAMLGVTVFAQTPKELVEQGEKYFEQQDYSKAVDCFRRAAEQGDAEGQNTYGGMFFNGTGVEQNHKTAFEWFQKSANQGCVEGQFDLGYCYENGYGVEKDTKKAIKWYIKAAEQGNNAAVVRLENIELLIKEGSNGKKGCVDKEGQIIIPYEYDSFDGDWSSKASSVNEGFIKAKKNGKWGIIDLNNNIVIPFEYNRSLDIKWFSDGLCAVNKEGRLGKWGFVDAQNHLVIPFEYSEVNEFRNGLCLVEKDNRDMIIDKNNTMVYYAMDKFDGFRIVYDKNEDKRGVIDKSNQVVIPLEYQSLKFVGDEFFGAKKNDSWGIIDKDNQVVIPFEYEGIGNSIGDHGTIIFRAKKNGKWGSIDKNNRMIKPFEDLNEDPKKMRDYYESLEEMYGF